ncbi:MAG: dienelactone hydrolase family protein [Sporichthyaceae bacterium]|nr:dienelactone hydrolase family protein [Sporichthyaceae bacterium]
MTATGQQLRIPVGAVRLDADLIRPEPAHGVVLFAHGSGSSRHSPRNRYVATQLAESGLVTVLADLLTPAEEQVDLQTRHLRFDIDLLAERVIGLVDWLAGNESTAGLPIGVFGASTGAAAALVAAAARPDQIASVVSRGGRADLAGRALAVVRQPTLLVVGANDPVVIDLNRQAIDQLTGESVLEIVPGASHLFEEPGTLERVAALAGHWFARTLR